MSDLRIDEAGTDDASEVCQVIHAAFGGRLRLDPPSTALEESEESVRAAIASDGGLLCRVDGEPAGALLFGVDGAALVLRRVSVAPGFQTRGVASALVGVAEEIAGSRLLDDVRLTARVELPETVTFWRRRGYAHLSRAGPNLLLGKALGASVTTADADATRALARRLGGLVRGGDVVVLVGDLGAGKTTFTQGLGAGLEIRGDVTSPTFVISRMHPSLVDGPALVHVDGYRLGGAAELDDLDLDAYVDDAVTVVEWGDGLAEALSDTRLTVRIGRPRGTDDQSDAVRHISVTAVGARWFGSGLRSTILNRSAHL